MSSRRRPGAGFTLEVQHLGKGLGGGSVVKAFARGVVVGGDELSEAAGWEGCEIGFTRDEAAHSTDGIFDAALLPGGVGIAEEGFDREAVQGQMAGELGTIVESNGLPQGFRQGGEQAHQVACDAARSLAGETDGQQQTRLALMHRQDRLAVF